MYNRMVEVFVEHAYEDDIYDVDMYCSDLCKNMFLETDPQDIDTDNYLIFQEALILLIRDDRLLDWFGLAGLSIIYANMLDYGEHYYIYNEIFNN